MDDLIRLAVQKSGPVRSEELQGRPVRVFPAVLVREQVLSNNLGKTFLPASEIIASVEAWNGMPVVVRHPKGESARSPEVLNERGVGSLFNARWDGALKADVFLEDDRVSAVEGADVAVDNVESGAGSELSTGFFCRIDPTPGEFDGKKYAVVLRDLKPDHLALLPDEIGACSVKDGCGLGMNHAGACDVPELFLPAAPEHHEEAVALHLAKEPKWRKLLGMAANLLGLRAAKNETDYDRAAHISAALRSAFGRDGRMAWLDSLDSTTSTAIWSDGSDLFEATFEVGSEGAVTFGEPKKVRRVTTFEPAANVEGDQPTEDAMNREQMIAHLAANGRDKETLAKLSDCDVKALYASTQSAPAPAANAKTDDPQEVEYWRERALNERKANEELQRKAENALQNEKRELFEVQEDLIYNGNTGFTTEEIRGFDLVMCKRIQRTVENQKRDFTAARGGVSNANSPTTLDWAQPIFPAPSGRN